jgi:hypothetical protein
MKNLSLTENEMLHIQFSLEDRYKRLKKIQKMQLVDLKDSMGKVADIYRKLFSESIEKALAE